ncbi:MAG: YqgE/AlgH family protein [Boseongicola sp.]|nr:YqgE/AlgH family protein [Boseongicola sp.]NNJ67751.1 YqgE/AlgH family protein [Boseongicola sp.]
MSATETSDPSQLEGKLLIAMPGMGDPRFDKSVIFMCAHSADGALGLIVNKPTPELSFAKLLKQLEIDVPEVARNVSVHFGGPVEGGRGFVLHSGDFVSDVSTLQVSEDFGMTATLDVMEALAGDGAPRDALLALGYAGWGPGQLEAEIMQNGWLTCDATRALVFEEADETKWTAALATLGVDALMLSADAGRA